VLLHDVPALAERVPGVDEDRVPHGAARGGQRGELPQRHALDPGRDRDEAAEDGDEAAEEDRRAAVAEEELLGAVHVLDLDEREPLRDPARALASDDRADRVERERADDRPRRRPQDRLDEAEAALARGEAGERQDDLARQRWEQVLERDRDRGADGAQRLHEADRPPGDAVERGLRRRGGGEGEKSGGHGPRPYVSARPARRPADRDPVEVWWTGWPHGATRPHRPRRARPYGSDPPRRGRAVRRSRARRTRRPATRCRRRRCPSPSPIPRRDRSTGPRTTGTPPPPG